MKILISPAFGAGWTTWMGCREEQELALTYKPLIEAIEKQDSDAFHDALNQFVNDCKEKFDSDPYTGGARDLVVVDLPAGTHFMIEEYDGSESLRERDGQDWYIATEEE